MNRRTTTASRTACALALLALWTAASFAAPVQRKAAPEKPKPAPARPRPADPLRQRCLGSNPNAPILIEVFSDYQCPACRDFYLQTTRPLLAEYANTGKVCIVYYEFPLRNHPYARQAARYGEAAARLGPTKWIQVTDALYAFQSQWAADGKLEEVVAGALSAKDMVQVRKWQTDPKLEAEIDRDIAQGTQRGVRSTPTVFLTANGKTERVPPGVQYPILRRYLDSLLER